MPVAIEEDEEAGCDCCDSKTEHEAYLAKQELYWSAYFGDSVKNSVESERLLKQEGIKEPFSQAGQHEIQWRLK